MKTGQLLQTYWEQKLGYEVYYLVKDLQLTQEMMDYKVKKEEIKKKWLDLEMENLAN